MLSYQNTLNQGLTERSEPNTHWESIEEIEALLREKCASYPTNFSKNLFLPNLLSNTDRITKCAGTGPKSGAFYDLTDSTTYKGEECVDLDRLLYDSLDESDVQPTAAAAAIDVADDIDLYSNLDHRKQADTTNPFIFNKNNNSAEMGEYNKHNNNIIRGGYQSANTSASQSPTNVLAMDYSNHFPLYPIEIKSESGIDNGIFDPIYDSMIGEEKLFYTPDNSCGPMFDFVENKIARKQLHPPLMLNLKGTFVNDDEEINTPNIIDTIMEASEQPLQFIRERDEIFNEGSFFSNSIQDFTPCPSTASPAAVSDTTDSYTATDIAESTPPESPAKKSGRSHKRRYNSDVEIDDEEEDETYVPPTHVRRRKPRESRAVAKKRIIYERITEDEDEEDDGEKPHIKLLITGITDASELEQRLQRRPPSTSSSAFDEEIVRAGKRGRPRKHARSISSSDYDALEPEKAKYREMRDKNNEASRKSRYKRKLKEVQMSDELEDLEMENVKLKTQVEELQKTVERYRDNLMQVMMSKK